MFPSLFVVILGLCYCSEENSEPFLGIPWLSGPSEALVKTFAEFNCELPIYPEGEPVLLQLFKVGNRDNLLAEYTSLDGEIAAFPMIIKLLHEGNLECVAHLQNNSNVKPTVSNMHHLKVVEPVRGAEIEVLSGRVEFFEGETLELRCKLSAGNHVSYKWLLNNQLVSHSHVHGEILIISRTTSKDSGSYMCVATNIFNKTNVFNSRSTEVITVKDLVSHPDISFTVLKEDSHNYSAMVTCQSTKGTPPILFSIYNMTELVASTITQERNAKFKVPLVLGEHLGWLQCQARNGDQIAYSAWIPLEVVPVGGPVTMHYDYDVGENYAVTILRFYCKAAEGSLPRYQWFLNKTLLHDRGSFYYVDHQPPEHSILVLSASRSSAGTYHCEVSDNFDNTTAINSKRWYLDKEVLNRLPVLVVAVVFGCFTALLLVVTICCWVGVVFRRRRYGGKSLVALEMDRMVDAGEPDLNDFTDDADVVKTASDVKFDQASEASVDEWPQIEEEKTTIEDEPAEEP